MTKSELCEELRKQLGDSLRRINLNPASDSMDDLNKCLEEEKLFIQELEKKGLEEKNKIARERYLTANVPLVIDKVDFPKIENDLDDILDIHDVLDNRGIHDISKLEEFPGVLDKNHTEIPSTTMALIRSDVIRRRVAMNRLLKVAEAGNTGEARKHWEIQHKLVTALVDKHTKTANFVSTYQEVYSSTYHPIDYNAEGISHDGFLQKENVARALVGDEPCNKYADFFIFSHFTKPEVIYFQKKIKKQLEKRIADCSKPTTSEKGGFINYETADDVLNEKKTLLNNIEQKMDAERNSFIEHKDRWTELFTSDELKLVKVIALRTEKKVEKMKKDALSSFSVQELMCLDRKVECFIESANDHAILKTTKRFLIDYYDSQGAYTGKAPTLAKPQSIKSVLFSKEMEMQLDKLTKQISEKLCQHDVLPTFFFEPKILELLSAEIIQVLISLCQRSRHQVTREFTECIYYKLKEFLKMMDGLKRRMIEEEFGDRFSTKKLLQRRVEEDLLMFQLINSFLPPKTYNTAYNISVDRYKRDIKNFFENREEVLKIDWFDKSGNFDQSKKAEFNNLYFDKSYEVVDPKRRDNYETRVLNKLYQGHLRLEYFESMWKARRCISCSSGPAVKGKNVSLAKTSSENESMPSSSPTKLKSRASKNRLAKRNNYLMIDWTCPLHEGLDKEVFDALREKMLCLPDENVVEKPSKYSVAIVGEPLDAHDVYEIPDVLRHLSYQNFKTKLSRRMSELKSKSFEHRFKIKTIERESATGEVKPDRENWGFHSSEIAKLMEEHDKISFYVSLKQAVDNMTYLPNLHAPDSEELSFDGFSQKENVVRTLVGNEPCNMYAEWFLYCHFTRNEVISLNKKIKCQLDNRMAEIFFGDETGGYDKRDDPNFLTEIFEKVESEKESLLGCKQMWPTILTKKEQPMLEAIVCKEKKCFEELELTFQELQAFGFKVYYLMQSTNDHAVIKTTKKFLGDFHREEIPYKIPDFANRSHIVPFEFPVQEPAEINELLEKVLKKIEEYSDLFETFLLEPKILELLSIEETHVVLSNKLNSSFQFICTAEGLKNFDKKLDQLRNRMADENYDEQFFVPGSLGKRIEENNLLIMIFVSLLPKERYDKHHSPQYLHSRDMRTIFSHREEILKYNWCDIIGRLDESESNKAKFQALYAEIDEDAKEKKKKPENDTYETQLMKKLYRSQERMKEHEEKWKERNGNSSSSDDSCICGEEDLPVLSEFADKVNGKRKKKSSKQKPSSTTTKSKSSKKRN